jgi:hypothetical protein
MKAFQLLSRYWLIVFFCMLATTVNVCADTICAERDDGPLRYQYEGHLGNLRIGLTVNCEDNKIEGGHYFYQKYLRDIPIAGSVHDSQITLTEPGGGVFHLHFIGNGSEGNQPLNFENSIGMEGAWTNTDGKESYPVSLSLETVLPGPDDGHRYRYVTNESDAKFEKRVQSFLRAVFNGDKTTAVRFISYPLHATFPNGKRKKLRNKAEVLAAWEDLFTSAVIAKLKQDLPHDMFVHNGMAMLGNGEAWFDGKGLAALQLSSPMSLKR